MAAVRAVSSGLRCRHFTLYTFMNAGDSVKFLAVDAAALSGALSQAASTTDPSASSTDPTTTSNFLLNESGGFEEPKKVIENVSDWWTELDLWNRFQSKLPTLVLAAVTIALGYLVSKLVFHLIERAMKRRKVDYAVYHFIARLIRFVIFLGFLLNALSMFFNVSTLWATLGAAGVAIALGLQDSVSQFVSGIQILINRPFKTGDYVEVAGVQGNIAEIGFMNTILITLDNKRVIVPNSDITKNHITNYSAESRRRVDLTFSISYGDDIARAKAVVRKAAEACEKILRDPAPEIVVGAHSSSSIDLFVRVWCLSKDYWDVFFEMQETVKLSFDANDIHIPFEQVDVHIVEPPVKKE